MNIGWQEILLILLIALLLFGAKKIPDLARSLGKGIKEFKKGIREIDSPVDDDKEEKVEKNKEQ
ncbi:twin-arginine translocase TatA/TatE family subunit [candidate division WOR-3 bacterium]|nr:twin-arginine translocase TatA/TatE family subunit [candidate division WOR-3 bacterium]